MIIENATQGTLAVTTSSQVVLVANGGRKGAVFVNASDTDCYLGLGTAAVVGEGIYLAAAGGTYKIDENQLFVGAVNAIGGLTKTLTFVEYS